MFTEHMGLEMMFHVATLLPFTPTDNQQVGVDFMYMGRQPFLLRFVHTLQFVIIFECMVLPYTHWSVVVAT